MCTPTSADLTEPDDDAGTPAPVVEWSTFGEEFVPIPVTSAVARLMLHEKSRYRAAADHARRIYPGSVGELVHRELIAYAEFGYRMARDGLIPRLVVEVLATPGWPPTGRTGGGDLSPDPVPDRDGAGTR